MTSMIIKARDLEIQDIVFSKLEDSPYITSQRVAIISHKKPKNKLLVQTPVFISETYGIPREGPYYPTARSRSFYKLPFCHERRAFSDELDYEAIEVFYNKLKEIDMHCSSEGFRIQMFGDKNAQKYEYQPLVRTPDDADEETIVEGKTYYRPPYTKVKLDMVFDTEQPCFKLFDKTDNSKQAIELKSFEDVLQHMRYMTKHRMVIHFSRLYAMKTSAGHEKKKYGIILKAFAVECTNKPRFNGGDREADLFID
jgi:hypothetical protein